MIKAELFMQVDDIVIFILPVCDFSKEESQNLSLERLNELWTEGGVIKYRFSVFIEDINDDLLVDNTKNWIVMREELQKSVNKIRRAV